MNFKPRAWLKEAKLMLDVVSINYQFNEVYFGETEHGEEILFPFEDIILMQSTGLKNGWYEDDIIEVDYDGNKTRHVIKYFAEDDYPAFDLVPSLDGESNGISSLLCGDYLKYELIGNVHSNPELLGSGND